jgi:hypothetical protein
LNKKIVEFKIDDCVSVQIPRIDRGGTDLPRIPGIVVKVSTHKETFYQVKTQYGILNDMLRASDLEMYYGVIDVANVTNMVALTTTAQLASNRDMARRYSGQMQVPKNCMH